MEHLAGMPPSPYDCWPTPSGCCPPSRIAFQLHLSSEFPHAGSNLLTLHIMTSIRFLSLAGCLFVAATLCAQQPPQSYNTALFGTLDPEPLSGSWKYSSLIGYAHPNG